MSLYNLPEVIINHPNLFVAKLRRNPEPKDKPNFNCMFMFDADAYNHPLTLAIREAATTAAIAKFGKAAFDMMVAEDKFESPFKKDVGSKKLPEGIVRYITCSSGESYPPGVFMRDIDPATKRPKLVTDKREIYSGAFVRGSVTIRAYGGGSTGWKAGVKLDLVNVQKLRDGTRITSGGAGDGGEFDALPPLATAALPGSPLDGMLD